jgi:molecular chaperone DnaJ
MAAKQDYYGTLGLARGASEDEIRKSYRKLARKHHPDLNPGDKTSEERFKKVQEAYDVLSDEKKRKVYDQYGFYSDSLPPNAGPQPGSGGMGFEGFDFSEAARGRGPENFEGFSGGGGFRDVFSQFFSGRAQPREPEPEVGSDLEYGLSIDFWQSIRGTQVRLSIQRQEVCEVCHGTGSAGGNVAVCPECDGTGQVTQMAGAMKFNLRCPRCDGTGRLKNVCPECRGEGRKVRPDVVDVRIPPGVAAGSRLRVAGKGNAGTGGAQSGDLYITVRVEEHPFFKRDGDDIEIQVPLTISEAGLGAKIEVPTIDGRALLKIPQGTQNGQKFRLRDKGVFNSRKNTRGDEIVEAVLRAPKVQDERTRELLRELAQVQTEDPRSEMWTHVQVPASA